ncbi:DUF6240 domain-containing protein [Lachnospiraceae bacterium C1.1]|nr:DUF6240 domain-containing protein [Lachnospiraceae bacterium C1.1]
MNPMEVDITALNAIADSFSDEENGNAEGYAKFLVRLEHNNEITDEEANSYIGIYRLFDKIEKSDGAIIGSLLSSGKDLTLKNLLTESRNRKKYGKIDESINDDHIMTEMQANSENMKIDAQIETAFQDDYMRHSAREALRKMMPESLKNADINENSSFEEIISAIEEYSEESAKAVQAEYERESYWTRLHRKVKACPAKPDSCGSFP